MSEETAAYQCPECGLHYENELTVTVCEAWCTKHKSCNLEIAQFALEHEGGPHGKSPTH